MTTTPALDGFELHLEPPVHALALDAVTIDDRLDEPFEVELLLRSELADLELAGLTHRRASLAFPTPLGTLTMHGLVARASEESSEERGLSRYRLRVVPLAWLATLREDCRIFQAKPIDAVVTEVLEGIGSPPPEVRLTQPLPSREYLTQFRESDWDFARRLLADEGVSLRGLHDGSGRLVLTDDLAGSAERVGNPIPFRPHGELRVTGPHVSGARFATAVVSGSATVRDHDFERPRLRLEGHAAVALDAEATLERYGFERHSSRIGGDDERRANLRLEEARTARTTAEFDASFALPPGSVFTLAEHPRAEANVEWLVVRCVTDARLEGSSHRLHCVPASARHRPRRLPKPLVLGAQTAVVVGEAGREIDVDRHGRVIVKFPWDRRVATSGTTRRVRVSQGWAGPGYGFVCLPRVGDEVIVEHLGGDPDEPLVVGRVHDGAALPPQPLPEHASRSTWRSRSTPDSDGFNELTFEDAAGAELVYVHAERDVAVEVKHDVDLQVVGDVRSHVRGNTSGGVLGNGSLNVNGDVTVDIGGTAKVHAATIQGSADGNLVLSAGAERHDESANHFVATGGFYARASSVAQFVTPHFHVFSGGIRLVAGGSEIALTSGGITIKSGGPVTVNGSVIKLNC
jgi:type VI secretion system secreted protein VgrG